MKHGWRSILIGLTIGLVLAMGLRLVQRAPDILVAWGNAWAEAERRGAAEDARRAEQEKIEAPIRKANEDYNEANCKVTVHMHDSWGKGGEVITGVRKVQQISFSVYLTFGGGVERQIDGSILKTENCR